MTDTSLTITLTPDTMAKLRRQVQLPDAAAVNAFVADAINSYLQLGQLYMSGGSSSFWARGAMRPSCCISPFNPIRAATERRIAPT